jgi:HAD superfamily hydrolase (TIGR01450 family)
MSTIAVVGLGAMGSRIAGRLLATGHNVAVWNRTREKMARLAELGAKPADTPSDAARRADAVVTMVSGPQALRDVTVGPAGVAAGAGASTTIIQMSTVGPAETAFLAPALPVGTELLDSPVLGSVGQAESGSLTILVGGSPTILERVRPILSALGTPVHVGARGAGASAKLVANATLFGVLATLGEAIALASSPRPLRPAIHQVLAATPLAAQARRRRPTIEAGLYPPRFALSLARKDAGLVADSAADAGLDLRVAKAARDWLSHAETFGWGDRDYTAVLEAILRSAGHGGRRNQIGPPTRAGRFDYDGLIVDLDGVVWLGGEPIEGAAAAIASLRAIGTRVLFVTNDPQSSRDAHAARLTSIGIPATAGDVMTAATATARFLGSHCAGRDAYVIGSRALRDEIERSGLRLVPAAAGRRADVVVVGGHEGFDYGELRAAATAIRNGAVLYATGRDAVFPAPDGLRPATGAILAAVEVAAGATATVIGKPAPFMFELARDALAGCRGVAVVGDHLISDIAGGKRAGLDAILVLTGTATPDDVEEAVIQPDLVLPSLAALPDLAGPRLGQGSTGSPSDPFGSNVRE